MSKLGFVIETLKGNFVTKEVTQERKRVCSACKLYDDGICSKSKTDTAVKTIEYEGSIRVVGMPYAGCGCIIGWKTRLINEQCPLGKWGAEN